MKKLLVLCGLLIFCATGGYAQGGVSISTARRIVRFIGPPALCSEADKYYNLTSHTEYTCTAANTWTAVGGGGGTGTVTSVGNGTIGSLFTATWATPTTTPTLSLDITNQGTTAQVLHGNAAGHPTFGPVVNADITANTIDVATKLTGTLLAAQEPAHIGDATNTAGSLTMTVPKVNGVAYSASPSTDTVPVITAANTATYKAVPDCTDTTGNHLNYTASTHTISCGTSSSGGVTNSAGNNIVTKSNGVNLVASGISDNGTTIATTEVVTIGTATTGDANADNIFAASAAGKKVLVLQAKASPTKPILDIQNSDGTSAFTFFTTTANKPLLMFGTGAGLYVASPGIPLYDSNPNVVGSIGTNGLICKQTAGCGIQYTSDGTQSGSNNGTGLVYLAPTIMALGSGDGWLQANSPRRVSTQFDKTSNITLSNITGLSMSVVAGHTYRFQAELYTTSNVGGGVQAAIGGTATATSIVYEGWNMNASTIAGQTRASALGTAVAATTAVTAATIFIKGTITVNAAGTLTVQFAQNASNGTASSVLVGSTFTAIDIP